MDRITNAYFKRDRNLGEEHSSVNIKDGTDTHVSWKDLGKKLDRVRKNSEKSFDPEASGTKLHRRSRDLEIKLANLRSKQDEKNSAEEIRECTFKPRINKSSSSLDRDSTSRKSLGTSDLLY
jgi:hypothetical protein